MVTSSTFSIGIDARDAVPIRLYRLRVFDRYREPLRGVGVVVRLQQHFGVFEGQSFEPLMLTTDESGAVVFEWYEYPNYRPRRTISGELYASCDHRDAVTITLEPSLLVHQG